MGGDRLAYRRWGNTATDQPPLFFLQHYRGGMDHWDPLMTDGLAAGREVTTRLLHSMRRDRLKRGVVTLCIRGGQGIALALEAL